MGLSNVPRDPYRADGHAAGASAPRGKTAADCAYDALIVAAATMMSAQAPPRASSRMALLVCARRTGLSRPPQTILLPARDVLADLDDWLAVFRNAPATRRRALVRTMNPVAGSPWARMVREAAEQVGTAAGDLDPAGRIALLSIERALALPPLHS